MTGRVGVLHRATVVQGDGAKVYGCLRRLNGFGIVRIKVAGGLVQAVAPFLGQGQYDLAEAIKVEVFHDGQRLREGNVHAFHRF